MFKIKWCNILTAAVVVYVDGVVVVVVVVTVPFGLGTALQIFKAFVPRPIYPFIAYRAFFCSSSLPNLTKPYPLLKPDASNMTKITNT